MAESTLSIKYADISREVGHFLGWGRDRSQWTNTQKQDFDDIIVRGLRIFYFPPIDDSSPYYEWSFLRTTGSITLNTNTYVYDLPDNFGGTILDRSVTFPAGTKNRLPHKVSESTIRQNKAFNDDKGTPKYYAVRNKEHSSTAGQRWEIMFYPTPKDDLVNTNVTYRYVFVPEIITNTAIYPVGGAQYSETILAAMLASAEYKNDDDPAGPMQQKFQSMLQVAMRNDQNQKSNERGGEA